MSVDVLPRPPASAAATPLASDATNLSALVAAVTADFLRQPETTRLWLDSSHCDRAAELIGLGLVHGLAPHPDSGDMLPWIDRRGFHEWPGSALTQPRGPFPYLPTEAGHPLRPRQPVGDVYRRYDPAAQGLFSLRVIDKTADLDLFHFWMNQGRVAFFWELAKPKDELAEYLAKLEADPHAYGLIGCIDGEPSAYFEAYWGMEDRLGPHYDAHPYDHGWHALIGNTAHLGRVRTLAWFRTITHYLFLEDPRTERVVGEPRASHVKMLRYAADCAFDKVKEFDFPHKRAALMVCQRRRFFAEVAL